MLITIIDHIGRTVIGKHVQETDTTLTINNPVIVHVQAQQQTQRLEVQSFPYLFMEFLDPANRDKNDWTFNKTSIVTSNVVLDSKIAAQYEGINNPAPPVITTSVPADAPIIKVFND